MRTRVDDGSYRHGVWPMWFEQPGREKRLTGVAHPLHTQSRASLATPITPVNRTDHIAVVRAACVKANPDIVALEAGCCFINQRGRVDCLSIPAVFPSGVQMRNTSGDFVRDVDIVKILG